MPGRQFNRLPASGPMAQQAEQEYKSTMRAAGEEYEIEARALGQQVLTDDQYQNKMAKLHGKHSLKALQMNRDWNQRMTQINEYEKLGAAGTISPEQADQAQYGISGYRVPKQPLDKWEQTYNAFSTTVTEKFNPEGTGYDYITARSSGGGPDQTGHLRKNKRQ